MARRPRPAHRAPPKQSRNGSEAAASSSKLPPVPRPTKHKLEEPEESEQEFEEGSSRDFDASDEGELDPLEPEDDADADAPRVSLWDADDNLQYESESGDSEEEEVSEDRIQGSLQDIPLGALRRAQDMLKVAEPETESDEDSDKEDQEEESSKMGTERKGKAKERVEWSSKPRTDISKRRDKHAPMEVTSKRPVSRKRQVVEMTKIVPRDPRFLPMTGEFSADKFQQNYRFLTDNHQQELGELRATLKQARKRLPATPRDTKAIAEEEVHKLEMALKRAESTVNKDKLEKVQREALSQVKKAELEKRKHGKGEWHLKKDEMKKLVTKARYDALAKEGGQRAVKKAIEKKQKKTSQKEKRSRPESLSEQHGSEGGPRKRRRV